MATTMTTREAFLNHNHRHLPGRRLKSNIWSQANKVPRSLGRKIIQAWWNGLSFHERFGLLNKPEWLEDYNDNPYGLITLT